MEKLKHLMDFHGKIDQASPEVQAFRQLFDLANTAGLEGRKWSDLRFFPTQNEGDPVKVYCEEQVG